MVSRMLQAGVIKHGAECLQSKLMISMTASRMQRHSSRWVAPKVAQLLTPGWKGMHRCAHSAPTRSGPASHGLQWKLAMTGTISVRPPPLQWSVPLPVFVLGSMPLPGPHLENAPPTPPPLPPPKPSAPPSYW